MSETRTIQTNASGIYTVNGLPSPPVLEMDQILSNFAILKNINSDGSIGSGASAATDSTVFGQSAAANVAQSVVIGKNATTSAYWHSSADDGNIAIGYGAASQSGSAAPGAESMPGIGIGLSADGRVGVMLGSGVNITDLKAADLTLRLMNTEGHLAPVNATGRGVIIGDLAVLLPCVIPSTISGAYFPAGTSQSSSYGATIIGALAQGCVCSTAIGNQATASGYRTTALGQGAYAGLFPSYLRPTGLASGTTGVWDQTNMALTVTGAGWTAHAMAGHQFLINGTTYKCADNTATVAMMTASGSVASGTYTWAMQDQVGDTYGAWAISVGGWDPIACGDDSITIGKGCTAGKNGISIGAPHSGSCSATTGAAGVNSVVIGNNAWATGAGGFAMGYASWALGSPSIAVGGGQVFSSSGVAVFGTCSGQYGIAIGSVSGAYGNGDIAIGRSAIAVPCTCSGLRYGTGTFLLKDPANSNNPTLTVSGAGWTASALVNFNVRIRGKLYKCTANTATVMTVTLLGPTDAEPGLDAPWYFDRLGGRIAIGASATAGSGTASNSCAVGESSTASAPGSSVFGAKSTASGNYSTASGYNCQATGTYSTASGAYSRASGNRATALGACAYNGPFTTAAYDYSTAIGTAAITTAAHQIMMGTSAEIVHFPGGVNMAGVATGAGSPPSTGYGSNAGDLWIDTSAGNVLKVHA